MNIGNLALGGIFAVTAGPPIFKLLKLFIIFCVVCLIFGTTCFPPLPQHSFAPIDPEITEKLIQADRVVLANKMNAGNFIAQAELAIPLLYNDDPSDDQKAIKWLTESASKGYSKAQNHLASFYMRTGNKTKARELWILAAQGRENRSYGTGSYKARESLYRNFPADYDPKWGSFGKTTD